MTTPSAIGAEQRDPYRTTTLWRWRLVTGVLILAALCFRQAPGLIVPDTKLDLTANPGGFLQRALSMWDADSFGQLQNQAYGYLFPMGPFHWLLHEVGVPGWAVQRLWWTLILSVAFLGFWRLASALDIGRPAARWAGAFLFALSPRFLGEVAISSIEVWPMAVAPWVLLPLVDPRPRSWSSRILRSALAFGCVGGVNAVATGVTLVLPTLWFMTRSPSWRVLRHAAAWLGTCLAAGLWWLVPLVMLGRYSPPFLDWIENAAVTTGLSSTFNAFQGTSMWLNFLAGPTGPTWPAGWLFVTQPALILGSVVVSGLGLAGLSRRSLPERRCLVLAAVTGLVLLTMGYAGTLSSPLSPAVRDLLDGVLAAARNTHKFEVVLRLPLLMGATHLVGRPWHLPETWSALRRLRPVLVGLMVITLTAPALTTTLPRQEGYAQIPQHWQDAAGWLDANPASGTVLVVPAASFADFAWGSTKDDPLQALMRRPFAVRDAVPLGAAATTRLLDEVMRRLGNGSGGPELKEALTSMGVRFVVVRNDLRLDVEGDEPIAVHEALADSGIERVADFGITSHQIVETSTRTINERSVLPYPSVEIFDVGVAPTARLVDRNAVSQGVSGAEDVPTLMGALGPERAVLMGSDPSMAPAFSQGLPTVLTDGGRRQEVFFGRPTENTSATLTSIDPGRQDRRSLGYVADPAAGQTVLAWDGVADVLASSSASDANASLRIGPGTFPGAAFDGDPSTRWVSGTFQKSVGEWLEVDFKAPVSVEGTMIQVSNDSPVAAPAALVRVDTDGGSTTVLLKNQRDPQPLITAAGTTQRIRVTLLTTAGNNTGNGFSIAELTVPGVSPVATLAMPPPAAGATVSTIVMRSLDSGRTGCLFVAERPLCAERFVKGTPESAGLHRRFQLTTGATYDLSGTVLAAPGSGVDHLLDDPQSVVSTASSRAVPGAAGRPSVAVDDDLGTGWVAGPGDTEPTLTLKLPKRRELHSLQFVVDDHLAASTPRVVELRFADGSTVRQALDASGAITFKPRLTDTVAVTFVESSTLTTVEASSGFATPLPVGVSEVILGGAEDLVRTPSPMRPVGVPCGFGPSVTVGGTSFATEVSGTATDVERGRPLTWRVCQRSPSVTLAAGDQRLDSVSTKEFVPYSLELSSSAEVAASPATEVGVAGDGLDVPARQDSSLLVVDHNYNKGWAATASDGTSLAPIRVNGWQQGYVVEAGAAVSVREVFLPDRTYRLALLLGALVLLLVLVAVVVLTRRERDGSGGESTAAAVDLTRRERFREERAHRGGPRRLPMAPAADHGWRVVLLPLVLLILQAGAWGLLAVLVAAVVMQMVGRWSTLVVLACTVTAGGAVALEPWLRGAAAVDSTLVQALVLGAFALAVFPAAPGSWRLPHLRMGRSTQ